LSVLNGVIHAQAGLTKPDPFVKLPWRFDRTERHSIGAEKWEGRMGWLIPIAMLASAVIVAVSLTRL
jgi:hypothetical protein